MLVNHSQAARETGTTAVGVGKKRDWGEDRKSSDDSEMREIRSQEAASKKEGPRAGYSLRSNKDNRRFKNVWMNPEFKKKRGW